MDTVFKQILINATASLVAFLVIDYLNDRRAQKIKLQEQKKEIWV